MKIRKNFVQLDSEDIKAALAKYAKELHEKEFGYIDFTKGNVKLYRETTYSEPIREEVLAEVHFTKRPEKMPAWAQELRAALKPLYKGKGELYFNRRKDFIGVKLYCPRGPIDLAQAEKIVREVCAKHNKFVTVKHDSWLYHVAHLKKPVLEDKA